LRQAIFSTPLSRAKTRCVVLHASDGDTTNLALQDFAAENALLAHCSSRADHGRAWRPGAARRAASLCLKEREMAEGGRVSPERQTPLLEVRGLS
jgi:hypothetical protein